MIHLFKDYTFDIDCSWTDEEKIKFIFEVLQRMLVKERVKLLKTYNIQNRTKINAAFSVSEKIWDSGSYISNPKCDISLKREGASALLKTANFEDILIQNFNLSSMNPLHYITYICGLLNIKSNLKIIYSKRTSLNWPIALEKEKKESITNTEDLSSL